MIPETAEQQITQMILELNSSDERLLLQARLKVGTWFLLLHKLAANKPRLVKMKFMDELFPTLSPSDVKLHYYQFRHEKGNAYVMVTYSIREYDFSNQLKLNLEQYSYPN